jgi:hypothetical protein
MSLLSQVRATRREAPVRMVLHGAGGCGKSTFAASAPKPIFIAAEDGLSNIDAHALAEAQSWSDVIDQLEALAREKHDFRTLVVDSLDWVEPLCWAHVCRRGGKKDIEAFGYGKGYVAALDDWRIFLSKLARLRDAGMNVILIAHSIRKAVKNPEGDDFEQWQIKLHEKAAGLIKEWVDVVGFAAHEIVTTEANGRVKGMATGRRVLRTQPNAGYDAKTRYHMPRSMPLDWTVFDQAVRAGSVSPVERLTADFESKLAELGDIEIEAKARSFVEDRGASVASLSDAIATVNSYLVERSERKAS